jgi:hypothetical protein
MGSAAAAERRPQEGVERCLEKERWPEPGFYAENRRMTFAMTAICQH